MGLGYHDQAYKNVFLGILGFFDGFFELIKFGFINSPQSLCDIDM